MTDRVGRLGSDSYDALRAVVLSVMPAQWAAPGAVVGWSDGRPGVLQYAAVRPR